MSASPIEGGLHLADARDYCGGKQSPMAASPFASDKQSKLTAFKRIGFSARRAFKLVSRSIDYRSAARSGSDGDVSCGPQAPGDNSPRSLTPALEHLLSSDSFSLHHAASLPSPRAWVDLTAPSPRLEEDCRQHPPTRPLQLQQQFEKQALPPPTPPAPTVPPLKPRSLLSALLKRPTSSAAAAATDNTKPAAAAAPSPKSPMHHQHPSTSSSGRTSGPSPTCTSPESPSPQPGSPSPGPQNPCSLGRMYESLPAQQDCRNPTPHSLLVPQRLSRSAVAERIDLCLSAPSPHAASLKRVMLEMEMERSYSGAPTLAASAADFASSAPKPLAPLTSYTAAAAAAAVAARAGASSMALGPPDAAAGIRVPLALVGADEAAPGEASPQSVPADSLLSSSFDRGGRSLEPQAFAGAQPSAAAAVAAASAAAAAAAAAVGESRLLAVSNSAPPAMRRSCWCLEDYSLHKRVYKGKMSSVYKGRCLRSGLPVALKVYFKARVPTNVVHMVMREVSIHMQASQHRSVLELYGVFQNEDVVVLVMELALRGSLANICQGVSGGRLNEMQVRQTILEPLLDALSYLHGKGMCHRDIKPENLLFTSEWGFRLADFGVSINLLEERAVTRAGTADYMAPEVERCPLKARADENKQDESLSYTTAADVWSVGVLAYELLVGFPPVVGGGSLAGSNGRSLSFPASMSAAARDFITSALAQLPEERPTVRQLRCHPWILAASAGDPGRRQDIVL